MQKASYIPKNTPYENFLNAIHSDDSKITYGYHLKGFLKFCDFDNYKQLLEISDKQKFQAIREYIDHRINKDKVSYSSVNLSTAAIKLFYEINGVESIPNWKQITRLKGKFRRVVDDELYTDEEIKLLLEHADLTEKVAVLTLLTSGMRVGALAGLRYKDIKPVIFRDFKFYRFVPYGDDLNERYVTFCTPECASMIDIYLKHRKEKENETLTDDSPFIKHKTNSVYGVKMKGFYSSKGLQKMLERLRYDANIESKTAVESGKHTESGRIRKRTMRAHVFRKIFNTRCVESNVNHTVKESLMGHKAGLGMDVSYFRGSNIKELAEYWKVVESLTISRENKLSKRLQDKDKILEIRLKEREDEIQDLSARIERLSETREQEMEAVNSLKSQVKELVKEKNEIERNFVEVVQHIQTGFTDVIQKSDDLSKEVERLKRTNKKKSIKK